MSIHDLIDSFEFVSALEIFYNELCMISHDRNSIEFQRAYGNVFGYLMSMRVSRQISAADLSSILESIRTEIGLD